MQDDLSDAEKKKLMEQFYNHIKNAKCLISSLDKTKNEFHLQAQVTQEFGFEI